MKDLIDVAADLQAFCGERGWEFCFIGGLAVQALAEPRLTRDTDMTLLTGFGSEEPFIDALLERYEARRKDAKDFADEQGAASQGGKRVRYRHRAGSPPV